MIRRFAFAAAAALVFGPATSAQAQIGTKVVSGERNGLVWKAQRAIIGQTPTIWPAPASMWPDTAQGRRLAELLAQYLRPCLLYTS